MIQDETRVPLQALVARQLPEFVREDYPTFVAFVEAYYEYMQANEVDLEKVKDIDQTLDDFIQYFKKELAVNLPIIVQDERLLLQHIKDQYLAKGSEGSYKLLFRMLFGKNVQLIYPGQQMLIASDGRWSQENSIFVQVEYGDPAEAVGRLVDIQSGDRILRVLVDRKEDLVGEVDRIVALGDNIYEMFLDKKFFGVVNPGDRIKYQDKFQAIILPSTTRLSIAQGGRNFRIGQVFNVQSGNGTGALMKVTATKNIGGIKGILTAAEFIKFGVGYTTDFAVNILASNTVLATTISRSSSSSLTVTDVDELTGDRDYALAVQTLTVGMDEQGYINSADYFAVEEGDEFVDSTYAGTILREFALDHLNANTDASEPAIIDILVGALNRYPGYFETNNGFLSDSIFIQDSKYYQRFSYVLRIDERLDSYASAVKTMIHPSGMKLFGEYDIINSFNLNIHLEALVKSLGIGLEDITGEYTEEINFDIIKVLADYSTQDDTARIIRTTKALADSTNALSDAAVKLFSKTLATETNTFTESTVYVLQKSLSDTLSTPIDQTILKILSKTFTDSAFATDVPVNLVTKYVTDGAVGVFTESGEIWINPYNGQDYFAEDYVAGLASSF